MGFTERNTPPQVWAALVAALPAGAKPDPAPKRQRREVKTGTAPRWAVALYPACRVVTESNTHEHWRVKAKRVAAHKACVNAVWWFSPLGLGRPDWHAIATRLTVTLTHVGPRMDDDNLHGAFKAVRDEIARLVGVDDGSDFYDWRYEQRTGKPGVEIRIANW